MPLLEAAGAPLCGEKETIPPLLQQFFLQCSLHVGKQHSLLAEAEEASPAEPVEASELAGVITALLVAPDAASLLAHPSSVSFMCGGGGADHLSSLIDASPTEPWGLAAARLMAAQPEEELICSRRMHLNFLIDTQSGAAGHVVFLLRFVASDETMEPARRRLCLVLARTAPPLPSLLVECVTRVLERLSDVSETGVQEICAVENWEESIKRHEGEYWGVRDFLQRLKARLGKSPEVSLSSGKPEEGEGKACSLQDASVSPSEDTPTMEEYIEYTVRSALLASNFLRELHDRNEKLIELLTQPRVQTELVRLLTEVEFDAADAARHFALPFYAAEVFCIGATELDRSFLQGEETAEARDQFWNILKSEPPLNAVLAGYFSRCWQSFLRSCPFETCAYLRQRGDAEELLVLHLYSRSCAADLYKALICSQVGDEGVIDLSGLIPRLLELLRAHDPLEAPLQATAAHGAAAAAARAALDGRSPAAVAAAAAAAAEAAKGDVAFQEAVVAQLDPHLPVTLIIRELLFQRATLPFFPVLLKQLTSRETIETLTNMVLSNCAKCLSSAVAIMSDLLSCTCIGKPLTCSERSSSAGESTLASSPMVHNAFQQKQVQQLFGEAQGKFEGREGQQEQRDATRIRTSSAGMSFTRGGGQQLERQCSLSGDNDDEDDSDSDDEAAFRFFDIPDPAEGAEGEQQRQHECGEEGTGDTEADRPDTSSVSSEYIRRAIAGLPEQPPGPSERSGQQAEEQQASSAGSAELQQEQQSDSNQSENEPQEETLQEHFQEYNRWRAECGLPVHFHRPPSDKTREWLESLERAEFVEQYILPQLLEQLENCCCMPATWRVDVQLQEPWEGQLNGQSGEEEQKPSQPAWSDECQQEERQFVRCEDSVNCSSRSVDSAISRYSFLRPLCLSQRKVHLPNGVFAAVGVEALELLTLVKALLKTHSAVVAKAVVDCGFVEAAVYLLFSYPWNSMLHISVTDLVQAAIARPAETRVLNVLINKTALLERILKHFKNSQAQRVRRLVEVGELRSSSSSSDSSSSSSLAKGIARCSSRRCGSTCSSGTSPSEGLRVTSSKAAAAGDTKETPRGDTSGFPTCQGEGTDSPLVVDTPEGPFCPDVVAAAVLRGALGRIRETCGYTSHLVQIAQLLMEQRDAGETDAVFGAEWQAVVDAELAFYRLLLQADKPAERTITSDVPTLGGAVSKDVDLRHPSQAFLNDKTCTFLKA
ncbi:hypothetical protein Esti_004021 [Eimeria stiedai]